MALRAVIFDLGGTLWYLSKDVNTVVRLGNQAIAKYLVSKGFNVEADGVITGSNRIYNAYEPFAEKSFIELDTQVLYSAILYQLSISDYANEELITGAVNSFYDPFVEHIQIFQDVKEVLKKLKEKGLKLGLITNNFNIEFYLRLLRKFDLEKFFDSSVASGKLGIRKPHKQIFLHCLSELGVNKEDSIIVGDSPYHDIQGAKNAGIRCIWVKRKEYDTIPVKPDWTVDSIKQVEKIITPLVSH